MFSKGVKPLAHGPSAAAADLCDGGNRAPIGGKQDQTSTLSEQSGSMTLHLSQCLPIGSCQRTDVQHPFILSRFPPSLFLKYGWSTTVTLIFESAFQLSKQTYQVEALPQEALLKEDYYDLGN
jgi:hypothetical protein